MFNLGDELATRNGTRPTLSSKKSIRKGLRDFGRHFMNPISTIGDEQWPSLFGIAILTFIYRDIYIKYVGLRVVSVY